MYYESPQRIVDPPLDNTLPDPDSVSLMSASQLQLVAELISELTGFFHQVYCISQCDRGCRGEAGVRGYLILLANFAVAERDQWRRTIRIFNFLNTNNQWELRGSFGHEYWQSLFASQFHEPIWMM